MSWAFGLLLISAATSRALQAQVRYADGMRLLREVEEIRRFKADAERLGPYERERDEATRRKIRNQWFSLSRPSSPQLAGSSHSLEHWFLEQARTQFGQGTTFFDDSVRLNCGSILLFMIGVGFASAAIMVPGITPSASQRLDNSAVSSSTVKIG
jgi:hypothetical protein